MRRDTQGALVLCLGVVAIRLVLNEQFLTFVKDAMRIPLLAAGGILVTLGLSLLLSGDREPTAPEPDHDGPDHDGPGHGPDHAGHDHGGRGPVVGWLLLVPVLVLLLVAPAPLGSGALDQRGGRPPTADVAATTFPPLPEPVDGAVELTLPDLVNRARFDRDGSLTATTVRATGFVAVDPDDPAGTFRLSRFQIACCAADALAWQVRVLDATGPLPPVDRWVEVEGVVVRTEGPTPGGEDAPLVELTAATVVEVDPPVDPYL